MAVKRSRTVASDENSQAKMMRMEVGINDLKPQLGLGFWGTKRVVLPPPTDVISGDCYHTPPPLGFLDSVPLMATIKNHSFLWEDKDFDSDEQSTAVRSVPVPLTATIKKSSLLEDEDSDSDEQEDPLALLAEEMEGHLRSMEAEPMLRPRADYLNTGKGGDTHSRAIGRAMAINWMVQFAQHCCFSPEILHLSVSYFDRYFSSAPLPNPILLVALSCLLIASKYEGVRNDRPSLAYMCAFAHGKYTTLEVIKIESQVLAALSYQLGGPTAKSFLDGFISTAADEQGEDELHQLEPLANYLADLSLLEYDCIQFLPSLLAASAVFLARFALHPKKQPWCPRMQHRTGYAAPELKECVHIMHNFHLGRTGLCLTHKYETVAIWFTPPSEIPASYLG